MCNCDQLDPTLRYINVAKSGGRDGMKASLVGYVASKAGASISPRPPGLLSLCIKKGVLLV